MGLFLALAAPALLSSCPQPCEPRELTLPVLISQTGQYGYDGEDMAAAYELARADFETMTGQEFALDFYDVESSAFRALEELKRIAPEPAIVAGPGFSTILANVQLYADRNDIALISPISNAFTLAFDDTVFRLTPSNAFEPLAVRALTETGTLPRHVVVLYRDEAYGHEMLYLTRRAYKADVAGFVGYEPFELQFERVVAALEHELSSALETYAPEDIFIYCIAFAELGRILDAAASHEVLRQVQWVCADGATAQDDVIATGPAREFACDVGLLGTTFSPNLLEPSPSLERVRGELQQQLGREPSNFAYYAYDTAWIAFKALDGLTVCAEREDILNSVEKAASAHSGITGPVTLNANGDRMQASLTLWRVAPDAGNGTCGWGLVGSVVFDAEGAPEITLEPEPVQ